MDEKQFFEKLKENGIELSAYQLQQFEKYCNLIQEWNEKINLTAITKKEEIYEKHFYDSLTIAFNYDLSGKSLLDIGAGAGLPSVALKIVFPSLRVTVMDSVAKKMKFVEEVIKELNLTDIQTIAARAEEYIEKKREKYDFVTARAVAKMNVVMELGTPYLAVGGILMTLKGAAGQEEFYEAKNAMEILHLKLIDHKEIILPLENAKRHNYYFRKMEKTNIKYPRKYAQIKQKPLGS